MVYDASGTRVLRKQGDTTTLYLDSDEITLNTVTSAVSANRYYNHAGQTVAVRTGASNDTVTTLISDWQGTTHHQINNATGNITTTWQDPYGNPRGTLPTAWTGERGFVGGTKDATGLTRIGARDYDPALQRFITVDPVQDLADPLQWNPYIYSNNSPITKADPTGLKPCSDYFSCGYQMPKRIQLTKYPQKRINRQMAEIRRQRREWRKPGNRPPVFNDWRKVKEKTKDKTKGNSVPYRAGCISQNIGDCVKTQPTGPVFRIDIPGYESLPWYSKLGAIGSFFGGIGGKRGAVGEGGRLTSSGVRALPSGPKIAARWGSDTYRDGGLMSTIEHINYRHAFNSGFKNVSRFADGTSARQIRDYVDEALRTGRVTDRGVIADLGRTIGEDRAGNAVTGLEVIVRDGMIKTAYPVGIP